LLGNLPSRQTLKQWRNILNLIGTSLIQNPTSPVEYSGTIPLYEFLSCINNQPSNPMLRLYKYTLGPVLLLQAKWLRKTALRLPEAQGARSGIETIDTNEVTPVRLLFVGDSSAAGVGVERQEQALAQQASRLVAHKLGRNVEWQLIAKSGVNTQEAAAIVANAEVKRSDVLITALGTNDVTSQRSARQFMDDYQSLLHMLFKKMEARRAIITGLPPLRILPAAPHPLRWYLGKCAESLDSALQSWVAQHPQLRYISLDWAAVPSHMARDRFHPGLGQYRYWAELVADHVVDLLTPNNIALKGQAT
jgi:lysophospholipase L1-like esterase